MSARGEQELLDFPLAKSSAWRNRSAVSAWVAGCAGTLYVAMQPTNLQQSFDRWAGFIRDA